MENLKFQIKTAHDENKILTIGITPLTEKKDENSKAYLFLQQNGKPNILIDSYEVIEKESSPDWKEYFEIFKVQGPKFVVLGVQCNVRMY